MTSSIRAASKGFSLIELMTAMAVSLIVVAAAAVLFAETGRNQRALDQISNANEVGSFVLRLVGRDLANAGFYPVEAEPVGGFGSEVGYVKPASLSNAYSAGLFGCEGDTGNTFNFVAGSCSSPSGGNPADSVVISYYTTDGFGAAGIGHRLDCAGDDVTTYTINNTNGSPPIGGTSSATRPLFVANHYYLSEPVNMNFNGQQVTTRSLRCRGLGGQQKYQDLISGLDSFQVTYGVAGGIPSPDSSVEFMKANKVDELDNLLPVVDPITNETFTAWQRVVAVRVCVVSKTYETSGVSLGDGSWTDCDDVPKNSTDLAVRKTYTQIFGIKNRQRVVY
jgi:type IV pilus assembly protein PilW